MYRSPWTSSPAEEIAYRVLPRVRPGHALAPNERRVLGCSAEILLSESKLDVKPLEVVENIERFIIQGQSKRAWRIRVLLNVIELLGIGEAGRPFSLLSRRDQERIFKEKVIPEKGPWAVAVGVRPLVLTGAYGDPRALEACEIIPVMKRGRFLRRVTRGGSRLEVMNQ